MLCVCTELHSTISIHHKVSLWLMLDTTNVNSKK